MTRHVLTHEHITPRLRHLLDLPEGTWQLVINQNLTSASYMDSDNRVHQIDIDDVKRREIQSERHLALV